MALFVDRKKYICVQEKPTQSLRSTELSLEFKRIHLSCSREIKSINSLYFLLLGFFCENLTKEHSIQTVQQAGRCEGRNVLLLLPASIFPQRYLIACIIILMVLRFLVGALPESSFLIKCYIVTGAFRSVFKRVKKWISHCIFKM